MSTLVAPHVMQDLSAVSIRNRGSVNSVGDKEIGVSPQVTSQPMSVSVSPGRAADQPWPLAGGEAQPEDAAVGHDDAGGEPVERPHAVAVGDAVGQQ